MELAVRLRGNCCCLQWRRVGYRRRSSAEAKRVQVLDAPTPSSSWFFNGERELESVPQEALVLILRVRSLAL